MDLELWITDLAICIFDADGGLSQVFKSIIANPGYVIQRCLQIPAQTV